MTTGLLSSRRTQRSEPRQRTRSRPDHILGPGSFDVAALLYLKVNVNVISKDVHSEEFACADLTGVLLVPVGQKMLVHVTPAGEHLCTRRALVGLAWTLF